MPQIIELSSADARAHFLKGSSYFNGDFPRYISFEPILQAASTVEAIDQIKKKECKNCWTPCEAYHSMLSRPFGV